MENKFSFGFQPYDDLPFSELYKYLGDSVMIDICTIFVCIFGLVANGIILRLLGFCTKRNPFTTYILNLTVSDFGFLLFLLHINIFVRIRNVLMPSYDLYTDILLNLLLLTHSSCQFLLTFISIDRCVAVFFPDWYCCHRSPNLPTALCAFIWVLLFLLCGIQLILFFTGADEYFDLTVYQYFVIACICLPLMTIATLTLFIKVSFKLQRHQRGKLLIVILLILLFSLLFSFLTNALSIAIYFNVVFDHLLDYMFLCGSLKSSINLLFFLLVGRWKVHRFQENAKVILQRVFKEEEPQHTIQTEL
ncbi:mas-related G-protein coupled receptor member H-like [Eublepharis macularius]|uniref:Mas-related G-protein coupled receptor member H-like n=1 Tax=Eublepharis macularius TaxID=481883 RepID=A0AA97JQX5_EUBMA|nr:mas-related G-protein coupled receptor member H-like [Eublepharis macularius]